MCHRFDDAEVQDDLGYLPFTIINKGGKLYIRVRYRGELKELVSFIVTATEHFDQLISLLRLPKKS